MKQVYLLVNQNQKVTNPKVTLGDITTVVCQDKTLQSKIRALRVYTFSKQEVEQASRKRKKVEARIILTATKLIELITNEYQDVEVVPIGSSDVIVELEGMKESQAKIKAKVIFICLIVFFGSAFSIMAFNNDVQVQDLFEQFYQMIAGKERTGITALEWGYSVGLFIGIIVFYNHFGKKKLSNDPTPLEIEMRLYENDIHTTLIDGVKRKNEHIDAN